MPTGTRKGGSARRRRIPAPPPTPLAETHTFRLEATLYFLNSCTCRPQLDPPPGPPEGPQPRTDQRPQVNTCPVHGAPSLASRNRVQTPPRHRAAPQAVHADLETLPPRSPFGRGAGNAGDVEHDAPFDDVPEVVSAVAAQDDPAGRDFTLFKFLVTALWYPRFYMLIRMFLGYLGYKKSRNMSISRVLLSDERLWSYRWRDVGVSGYIALGFAGVW